MSGVPVSAPNSGNLWRQVADLRPQLRHGIEVLAQDYRGERWYLLHDRSSGRFLRFNAAAYEFLGRLDGDLSVQDVLDIANAGREEQPVLLPEDVMQILAQLHGAEVLRGGLPLGAQDVLERYQQVQRFRRRRALSNPLALRIRLLDPDRLLTRLLPAVRGLFTWGGFMLWFAVVALAALLAVANSSELVSAVDSKTLAAGELLSFWLLYPVIKALHELAHGLAVKMWGGEVHETGISLLVFMPVPYVDASAAWALRDKRRRAIVGAVGIMVELFLAALALLVWLAVEPGLLRDTMLNVVLIGSVSTLLFNGNPLLRYDAYYVLEDLVEIPNLASRSSRYYLYLMQRYLLGIKGLQSPVTAQGESAWFAVYGLLSPLYRLSVSIAIALYLASEFLVVGVVLALWTLSMQIIRPLLQSVRFIATSPRLATGRVRAVMAATGVILLAVVIVNVPAPLVTRTQGVVWPAEDARVVSAGEGFVVEVLTHPGSHVEPGQVLLRIDNPELRARRAVLAARLQELRSDYAAQRTSSRVRAAMVADDIAAVKAELDDVQRQIGHFDLRSAVAGVYFSIDPHRAEGKLLQQGELVGYVLTEGAPLVRAVVGQDEIGLLRNNAGTRASVVLADRIDQSIGAHIVREVPAGSNELPSTALGALAGGDVTVDLSDPQGHTTVEKVFQIELALPVGSHVIGIGERAHVRLEHGREPLWRQWSRGVRQLLLSRLQT